MPLIIGSTIRGFSSSSALWALEVNRSPYALVDGCWNKLVNVVSIVPHAGSVLGKQSLLLYTAKLFTTLVADLPSL